MLLSKIYIWVNGICILTKIIITKNFFLLFLLFEGKYHPAISTYNGGSVTINFGPHFAHPIPAACRPYSEVSTILNWVDFGAYCSGITVAPAKRKIFAMISKKKKKRKKVLPQPQQQQQQQQQPSQEQQQLKEENQTHPQDDDDEEEDEDEEEQSGPQESNEEQGGGEDEDEEEEDDDEEDEEDEDRQSSSPQAQEQEQEQEQESGQIEEINGIVCVPLEPLEVLNRHEISNVHEMDIDIHGHVGEEVKFSREVSHPSSNPSQVLSSLQEQDSGLAISEKSDGDSQEMELGK